MVDAEETDADLPLSLEHAGEVETQSGVAPILQVAAIITMLEVVEAFMAAVAEEILVVAVLH